MQGLDVETVANQVVPFIGAAVGAYGSAVLTRVEDAAADDTVRMGQRLLRALLRKDQRRARIESAVADLSEDANDLDLQAALRAQIRLTLHQDGDLAAELASMLPERSVTSASGARSIAIAGDNNGIASTGDGSTNLR